MRAVSVSETFVYNKITSCGLITTNLNNNVMTVEQETFIHSCCFLTRVYFSKFSANFFLDIQCLRKIGDSSTLYVC